MKLVKNNNAPNCRLLAKEYLGCRMKNQLMDQSDWESLGFQDNKKSEATTNSKDLSPTK